jgi:ribosome modulation factor
MGVLKMSDYTELLPHIKFQFDLKHPTLEECYIFGYECALASVEEEANPYASNTKESEHWVEGWWAGFYGEEPLFDWHHLVDREVLDADNDLEYHPGQESYLTRVLEIAGVIAISAILGYQVLDLVA